MAGSKAETAAKTDEWTTIQEESPSVLVFDAIGDQFIGRYIGPEEVTPEGDDPFTRYTFRAEGNPEATGLLDGTLVAINSSWRMESAMSKAQAGELCRITYIKDIPTKRGLNPMKDFRVDVKR